MIDDHAAERIVSSLKGDADYVLEIGPGRGVLTKFLLKKFGERFHAVEIDRDLSAHLQKLYPALKGRLHHGDFLKMSLKSFSSIAIIGNFPYNISTQIIFRILEYREQVKEVVGMFQREVAKRIVARAAGKDYGIISVLLPCWYQREYLFELPPDAFSPPPKVHSAVIRLTRNAVLSLHCDEQLFKKVVKTAFNQRRKMLRNSLAGLLDDRMLKASIFEKRPEQLTADDFVRIVKMI